MDDLSEACMNPVSLDTGSREASFTQADEVGHFYITCCYEEGYDHYYDCNLTVVSDAADENGQTDNINPAGNPNCDVDTCQDDVEGWETDSEETTPKTALDNDNGNDITTTLSRCYNAPENSAQIPSCIGACNSSVRDEEQTSMSNNLRDATLSSTFTSSTPTPSTGSTKMLTTPSTMSTHLTSTPSTMSSHLTSTPSKMSTHLTSTPPKMSTHLTSTPSKMSTHLTSTPSKMSTHLTSTPSMMITTRPDHESTVRTSVLSTPPFYKEHHTEIFSSEKIILGGKGSGPGKFDGPKGVAVSSDNEIYVADTGNKRVQVFSTTGVFLRLFRTVVPGTNGQSMFPKDVAIDRKGYLWVVGPELGIAHIHVVKYNRDGLPESTFGLPSEITIIVKYGRLGIAADVNNDRIIVTSDYAYIHVFSSNGLLIHEIPCNGYRGCNVASGNKGNIIVLKSSNSVQVYNRDGHPLFKFRIGRGLLLSGICTDSFGHIIVAKTIKKKRVKIFMLTSRGEFVRTLVHILNYGDDYVYMAVGPAGQLVASNTVENFITIFPPQTVSP
ncbi:uncharacterized protein LOC144908191 [Branchiostoma floridae x Branchiostoma belcheri]